MSIMITKKKAPNLNWLLLIVFLLSGIGSSATTYYSRATGNWNVAGSWSTVACGNATNTGTFPGTGDVVFICATHTITLTASTAANVGNVQVAGTLLFSTAGAAGKNLQMAAGSTLEVTGTGTVDMVGSEGNITIGAGSFFIIRNGGTFIWQPSTNTAAGTTIITNTTETFEATSNLRINDWYNTAIPLGTNVTGDFGNVILDAGGVWDQDGQFGPNRIKGNFTLVSGQVNFNDGTGASSDVTIGAAGTGSVTVNNGTLFFHTGTDKNFTVTTGSMSITSGTGFICFLMNGDGSVTWNCNGSASIADNFTYVDAGNNSQAINSVVNITGDLTISGGLFDFHIGVTNGGALDVNVTGNINLSSTNGADYTYFLNSTSSGNMTVDCNDLNITGIPSFLRFHGGTSGSTTITTVGSFNVNTPGEWTDVVYGTSNAGALIINIGNEYRQVAGDVYLNSGDGNVTLTTTNNFELVAGIFVGTYFGDGNCTLNIGANFDMDAGTFYGVYQDDGDFSLTTGGALDQDGGNFRGIYNNSTFTAGNVTYNLNSVDYDGGSFLGQYCCNPSNETAIFNVTNNFDLVHTATTQFWIIGLATLTATNNTTALTMTVGGDFIISGNTAGNFMSSDGGGNESVTITGNVTVSGGSNSFNVVKSSGVTTDHNIAATVGGNITVSAGSLYLSAENNNSVSPACTWVVTGNVDVSGTGNLVVKSDDGVATLTVNGNYSETAGTFSLHENNTNATANVVAVVVNGTFSHTGGTLNFDDNTTSTAIHTFTLNGPSCTMGGTGVITHASAGTGTVFGEYYFNRAGTITFDRSALTHQINQTRLIVNSICTVDASASTIDMQIACNNAADDAVPPTTVMLDINGVLVMGTKLIHGRSESATQRPTSLYVRSGGELRTANTVGMYDGTTSATFVHFTRNSANTANTVNSFNWALDAASIVRYNSTGNQVVTGKFPTSFAAAVNNDIAAGTAATYKYGYLNIDNQGTLGTNYANPATAASTGNVFVRTSLVLTRGELNLAGSGTGQTITIENGATTGITRDGATTNGYIKSEEVNGGNNRAKVFWMMTTNTGAHIYPFGVTTGASNYVPFTFNKTTAGSSNITVSTRASAADDNLPWAVASNVALVNSMQSNAGTFYADATVPSVVDRWWDITASAAVTGNLVFSYRGVENTTTDNPTGELKAQHWDGTTWEAPVGTGTGVTAGVGTVAVTGASTFSPWVISSLNIPLPVEISKFSGSCEKNKVVLNWTSVMESNNQYYTIEKSYDAKNFFELSKVFTKAKDGNSNSALNYILEDKFPSKGVDYYRLSQTDISGKTEIVKMISVSKCSANSELINAYTIDKNITIDIASEAEETFDVSLYNSIGQLVTSKKIQTKQGNTQVILNELSVENGVYFINISSDNATYSKKLLLVD
ncbi:MAG: T9SS type A sorting domain-containing protein [Bacteroidota bacterium]|nr:T9SS type A sorting domain-containing protein [Bacteroidota bacterium]